MDIVSGITAASQALGIVKQLQDIDVSVSKSEAKLKIAELRENLADIKIALSEARIEISEKNEVIRSLEATIKSLQNGEKCEICKNGNFKLVTSVRSRSPFGVLGAFDKTYKCDNADCGHSETKLVTPE